MQTTHKTHYYRAISCRSFSTSKATRFCSSNSSNFCLVSSLNWYLLSDIFSGSSVMNEWLSICQTHTLTWFEWFMFECFGGSKVEWNLSVRTILLEVSYALGRFGIDIWAGMLFFFNDEFSDALIIWFPSQFCEKSWNLLFLNQLSH